MTTMSGGQQGTGAGTRTGALLQESASRAVPETADLWPNIQARISARSGAHHAAAPADRAILTRRPALAALAGGAAAAVALALPALKQGGTASASALLEQARLASEAASGGTPYHLRATRRVPTKGNATVSEEVWYAAPDRWRVEAVVREAGTERSRTITIVRGGEAWLVASAGGETRVVHTTGVAWSAPNQILPAADPGTASIAELLARYGSKNCGTGQLGGEATLLGRPTHVVVVTPHPDGCRGPDKKPLGGVDQKAAGKQGPPTPTKAAQAPVGAGAPAKAAASEPAKAVQVVHVVQLTVWVDRQTSFPLKLEARDASGALQDAYEVTSLEVGVAGPDDVFRYTPPPSVVVRRFTAGTPQEIKAALSRT